MHDRALETLIDSTHYLGLIPRDGTGQRPQNARPLIGGSLSEHQCNLCHDPTDREGTCINCLREKLKYTAECARCYVKLLGDSFHMRWKKRGKFVDGFVCNRCRGIIADSVTGEDYEAFQARRVTRIETPRNTGVNWSAMGNSIREEKQRMRINTGASTVFFPYKAEPFIAVGPIQSIEVGKDSRVDGTGKTTTTNVMTVTITVMHEHNGTKIPLPVAIKDAKLLDGINSLLRLGKCPFALLKDEKGNIKGFAPHKGQRFACYVLGSAPTSNGGKFTNKEFVVLSEGETLSFEPQAKAKYDVIAEYVNTPDGLYWGEDSDKNIGRFLALNGYIAAESVSPVEDNGIAQPGDGIPF